MIQQLKERQRLGLPRLVRVCLFDLDGVLTETANLHAAAWKRIFDAHLRERADGTGELIAPFDLRSDYDAYIDGKPRFDGVRDLDGAAVEVTNHPEPHPRQQVAYISFIS